ncbi:MAG: N-acetyl-gamma-glutamyl-phosphate reductase [Capsulimonadaceae bacterium]|nr:N-acetyl-gamma-glutamyl-phosphate reductase [Capsulimonadaceae bacterium]
MLRVGIVGVSGYGGGEIARLLLAHPSAKVTFVISNTYKDQPLYASFPGMRGRTDLVCRGIEHLGRVSDECDVVFLAQENGFAMKHAGALLDDGLKVIDLSADFRLRNLAQYPVYYKFEHASPSLMDLAVYGLPELYKEHITSSPLIANPGCYATGVALSLAPLAADGLVDPATVVVSAMSGVSGAGRSKHNLTYHFPELNESAAPYAIAGGHRHTPEVEQTLSDLAGSPWMLTFNPHLIPITRGILVTAVATLTSNQDAVDLLEQYRSFYHVERNCPFVNVLGPGELPATKHTAGTNYVHIGLSVDKRLRRVTVVAALDNLVKGAAGQAIQNMNLISGLPETTGLTMPAIWP